MAIERLTCNNGGRIPMAVAVIKTSNPITPEK